MARDTSGEDHDEIWDSLTGPMHPVFERAGAVLARKLRERGITTADLELEELAAMLQAALLETAADLYPGANLEEFERKLGLTFADMALEMAANADGSDGAN